MTYIPASSEDKVQDPSSSLGLRLASLLLSLEGHDVTRGQRLRQAAGAARDYCDFCYLIIAQCPRWIQHLVDVCWKHTRQD